jgi:hypothetical protein
MKMKNILLKITGKNKVSKMHHATPQRIITALFQNARQKRFIIAANKSWQRFSFSLPLAFRFYTFHPTSEVEKILMIYLS